MKEYKLGENTVLVVEVPEGANHFRVDKNYFQFFAKEDGSESPQLIILPEGNWTLLGKASSITEQQAKELVEEIINGFYKDYDESNIWDLSGFEGKDTALQSFSSWLTANGIDRESVLLKKERYGKGLP